MTETIRTKVSELLSQSGQKVMVSDLSLVKMRASVSYAGGKVLYFVFSKNEAVPCAVAKHTQTGSVLSAMQELKKLEAVQTLFQNTALAGSIPKPQGAQTFFGGEISVESYAGNHMPAVLNAAHIEAVFAWLNSAYTVFQKANLLKIITAASVKDMVTEYEKTIPNLWAKPEYKTQLFTYIDEFFAANPVLTGFPAHGDFHTGNILRINNALTVIDWGRYSELALPGTDGLFFLRRCPGGLAAYTTEVEKYFSSIGLTDKKTQDFCVTMTDLFEALERYAIGNTPYTADFFPTFFARNSAFFV